MFYPYTERQARFIAIAQELANTFAQRAAEHDRDGSFPFENYADVRAAGLPALIVPAVYGGWGADLLETIMTMQALAIGDGSTALNVTMHMQTLGGALEAGGWPPALLEKVCREAVEQGKLINSIATEPELGSPSRGGKPKTRAKPIYGVGEQPVAWQINGRKNFASMSPALDYMIIPAVLDDGSEEVARFLVPSSSAIEIVETWDAMGMRTTGSHDIILHDVQVPHEFIIARGSTDKPNQKGKANAWFALGVSAVYVGVAMAALQTATRYAQARVPTALGKPIAELESIQRRLGQAQLLIHQANTHLYTAAEQWDRHPTLRVELSPTVIAAKFTATNNAIDAVDHCMRVVGGSSMTRHLPLERYYRDVRGGLSHPMNDDQALVLFGQLAIRQTSTATSLQNPP
ncbi:MAG: acyl-CoA/acyl-ACP dehydrogenase [Caldilineaceae bacterium]|nr:acyl-CoA/acyl-ACP dehydrogenase [Caldilineaceae bacterium]